MRWLVLALCLLFASSARAECVPPPGGKCLTAEQFEQVKKALAELDSIHKAPAVVTTDDKIVVIHDWQGRVYTNGGDAKPLQFKLKLGDTIERDMAATVQTEVHYRPKPPDPMFRLRIRAQLGLLLPEMVRTFKGNSQSFWDAGIGWDFFHWKELNVSAYTGVRSLGAGLGYDLTKNFGPYLGYALTYDGFRSSMYAGVYFSFN